MTSIQLLKICQRALNEIVNQHGLTGRAEWPEPFNGVFTSYDLAAAVDRHLATNKGFTVILGYPAESCEGNAETYSSTSSAPTWEQAVLDVAQDMLDEEAVSAEAELTIVDVLEGQRDHSTYPGVDRYAVIRFRKAGPVLLDSEESEKEGRYIEALENARRTMEQLPGLEPRSAYKQAASDLGIPYGAEMGAFVEWAEKEEGTWQETS